MFAASFGIPTGYSENSLNQKIPTDFCDHSFGWTRQWCRTESKKPQDKTDKTAPPPATEAGEGWSMVRYGQNMVSIWSHFADFVTRQCNSALHWVMFFKYYTMLVAMEESQEPVEQPTRWLIKPKERVRLLLKFFSEDSSADAVRIPVGRRDPSRCTFRL